MKAFLQRDVSELKGVGPKRRQLLGELGLHTFGDILAFIPFRYHQTGSVQLIGDLQPEATGLLEVEVAETARISYLGGKRSLLQAKVRDESGSALASWFNQPYRRQQLVKGTRIWLRAQVQIYHGQRRLQVQETGLGEAPPPGLHAVYALRGRLKQGDYRKLIRQVLAAMPPLDRDDPWSEAELQQWHLPKLQEAIRSLHQPNQVAELDAARRRLAFDEVASERVLGRGLLQDERGWTLPGDGEDERAWQSTLPYPLTKAQQRCIAEIYGDMRDEKPMRRLLQGDVGSGKTAVAAAALCRAVASGAQAVLLAPTEILARQHVAGLRKLLPASVPLYLSIASQSGAERREVLRSSRSEEAAVWVGTHALLSDRLPFPRLGLVIVDEQHRFGVMQRQKLLQKRCPLPDLLCLSATPIPRTLALALFGDMAVSSLDEMPPGRVAVKTTWLRSERRLAGFFDFCRREFAAGHKLYWVCASIEADDESDLASVQERAPILREIWPEQEPLLLHGRLSESEKEGAMQSFLTGDAPLLLGTTVVEVGVDQPLATVIVIENAERFGLAQLHQLRGRVGRSDLPSYCVLIAGSLEQLRRGETPSLSDTAEQRLQALCDSSDGFELARLDLQLRGPGEVFGLAQSGFGESFALKRPLDLPDLHCIDSHIESLKRDEIAALSEKLQRARAIFAT